MLETNISLLTYSASSWAKDHGFIVPKWIIFNEKNVKISSSLQLAFKIEKREQLEGKIKLSLFTFKFWYP